MWSAPDADWTEFSAVVIRSCWDYHLRVEEFLAWIDSVEKQGVPVLNPPRLIRWNADKRYLAELSRKGIPIPGTIWLEAGEEIDLTALRRDRGWADVVVKPLVSASAYRTERGTRGIARGPLMIQEYLPAIESEGEWSLMYFGRELSHAVRKRPRAGEFRVQREFGGTIELEDPPAEVAAVASAALAAAPLPPVFARVDLVQQGASVLLMELEVIEPELFVDLAPGAAERLASSILDALA